MRLREYICKYRLSGKKDACVFETSCTAENRAEAIEFFKFDLPVQYKIISVKWRRF